MFLVGILSWWYGAGWLSRIKQIKNRFAISADFFSVGLLFTTLFAPFRQISASHVSGPIDVQLRAFFDRLISRTIGAIVRTFMIICGIIVLFVQLIFGIIVLVVWLVIPLIPILGLIAMVIGWVPQWKI